MAIKYICQDEGIHLLAQKIVEEKLTPILGAGFTRNCKSAGAKVPDGAEVTEIMRQIISGYSKLDLTDADFNKVSARFFRLVPKEIQWNFFEKYFTQVSLPVYLQEFLNLPWPYIYTLNIDDGIERTGFYSPVLPYQDAQVPKSSMKLVYKLHGDAKHEVLYKVQQNIVFSHSQYVQFLTSDKNNTILNAVQADYKQKNLVFIGCSLNSEPDLQYIYSTAKSDMSPNVMRAVIRTKPLTEDEEFSYEDYGINTVILVNDYELFYREVVKEYNTINAGIIRNKYQFTNPQIVPLDIKNVRLNLNYFSGISIFDEKNNCFYKSAMHILRSCIDEIEQYLNKADSVVVCGRRFSGKTFVLCSLAQRYQTYSVFYFPSNYAVDEEVLSEMLSKQTNSLFLFDSNALTDYAYMKVAHAQRLLAQNGNKIVVAVNSNDIYLSDSLNAEIIRIPQSLDTEELAQINNSANKYALIQRCRRETNMDYLKKLSDEQKIDLHILTDIPRKYSKEELVILMLLCIKDKLYYSDISALDIRFKDVDSLIERFKGLIEKVPVGKGEKASHSTEKLVHNSKYFLLSIMRDLSDKEIENTVIYIVSHLYNDAARKRLYIEAVLFDTLNQLFGYAKGAGKLILSIYEALDTYLNADMDYWLQRAKSMYRIYPNDSDKLKQAYQYAKKATMDGNTHIRAKASLTTSLICCLLARNCTEQGEKEKYEIEAIECAENAIYSDYFKVKLTILKDEIREGRRESYFVLICNVCEKHADPTVDLSIAVKAMQIKQDLEQLVGYA